MEKKFKYSMTRDTMYRIVLLRYSTLDIEDFNTYYESYYKISKHLHITVAKVRQALAEYIKEGLYMAERRGLLTER